MTTITTLPPPDDTTWHTSRDVLAAGALNGAVTLIGPRTALDPVFSAAERVLYVAQGFVTAAVGDTNYILRADDTLVVPAGRTLALRNTGDLPAKVLALTLAPRAPAGPELVTVR